MALRSWSEFHPCLMLLSVFIFTQPLAAQEDYAPRYLAKDEYHTLLESGEQFLVNFISPGCVKCSDFAPEYLEVAEYFGKERQDLNIKVFLEGELSVIRKQGLRRLPSVYYVREKTPIIYSGEMNADSVIQWVESAGRKFYMTLTDEDFEHLTQAATGATTGDWLVLFCDVKHSDCTILLPMWESIAYRLHSTVNVAVVDLKSSPGLVKRFNLADTPTMHLFRNGKRYPYRLQQRDDTTIIGFATNAYKISNGVDVEGEPSPFDLLTDNIANQLKEVIPPEHASKAIYIVVVAVVVLVLLFCLARRRSKAAEIPGRTKKGV